MKTDSILWKDFKLFPTVKTFLGFVFWVFFWLVGVFVYFVCFVLVWFLTVKFGNRAEISTSIMEP